MFTDTTRYRVLERVPTPGDDAVFIPQKEVRFFRWTFWKSLVRYARPYKSMAEDDIRKYTRWKYRKDVVHEFFRPNSG